MKLRLKLGIVSSIKKEEQGANKMFENCRVFQPLLPIVCSVVLDGSVTQIHALPSYSLIGSFPRRKLSYDAQGGEMSHTKNSSVSIIGGKFFLNFKKHQNYAHQLICIFSWNHVKQVFRIANFFSISDLFKKHFYLS